MFNDVPLKEIAEKPQDYKVCRKCNSLLAANVNECIECGAKEFDNTLFKINRILGQHYKYWNNQNIIPDNMLLEVG